MEAGGKIGIRRHIRTELHAVALRHVGAKSVRPRLCPTEGAACTSAQVLARAQQWEQFSRQWARICKREPETPDFKMQKPVRLLNEDGAVFGMISSLRRWPTPLVGSFGVSKCVAICTESGYVHIAIPS